MQNMRNLSNYAYNYQKKSPINYLVYFVVAGKNIELLKTAIEAAEICRDYVIMLQFGVFSK